MKPSHPLNSVWCNCRPGACEAFTLLELVVVLAVVAALSVSLLRGFASTRPNTQAAQCLYNLKRLSLGTLMYTADNRDCFPACAAANTYGYQSADWIYWRVNPAYPPLTNSPVVRGGAGVCSNWFRCPADRDNSARLAMSGFPSGAYWYSYSMTSFSLENSNNPGMASIFYSGGSFPFKLALVRSPRAKIMLAEEQASLNPGEASNPTAGIISDGRWVPAADALTVRHQGYANVAFADGHVATIPPQFGTNLNNSRPDY